MSIPDFSSQFDAVVDSSLEWLSDKGEFLFDAANAMLTGIYKGVSGVLPILRITSSP